MKTFVTRFIIKSKSNTVRYKNGNISAREYMLLQLSLIDLSTITNSIDEYVEITNAIYTDCESVGVGL